MMTPEDRQSEAQKIWDGYDEARKAYMYAMVQGRVLRIVPAGLFTPAKADETRDEQTARVLGLSGKADVENINHISEQLIIEGLALAVAAIRENKGHDAPLDPNEVAGKFLRVTINLLEPPAASGITRFTN